MPLIGTFGAGSAGGFGQRKGGAKFIEATGGTIVEDGDYKIHIFTGPGTFEVTQAGGGDNTDVDYFVQAGGGGGGANYGAGAGAGGTRVSAATFH
jgi:hypothetical protein